MKLSEFIVLDENEKAKTVIHEGVLVAKRKEAPMVRFLFQMDHYYVEMRCNSHDKSITEFHAYTDPTALTPFLEQIPLRDML